VGLEDRLEDRTARIGVVGLGYAGLPVALAFAEAGFTVIGVDLDAERVSALEEGKSYITDVTDDRVASARSLMTASTSYDALSEADAVLICVPTPLVDNQPDLSAVRHAGGEVARVLREGALVVLESTTYPGTTDEVLAPLIEAGARKAGEEFHLAYSAERIDPGNRRFAFREIPKVVGGMTPRCGDLAEALYEAAVDKVVRVSGTREAELAKLLENTFRHVNIALVNELAIYAHDLDIDIWQSIDAASSKPFGFMPFYPGPGVGGHCIGIDPSYLSWRVQQTKGHAFRFVELANELNRYMPRFVVERAALLLNERGRALKDARVLVVGLAYKPGIEDTRESPAMEVAALLLERGALVDYHDPLVPIAEIGGREFSSVALEAEALRSTDLVVVITPHPQVDLDMLVRESPLVFDTRRAIADPAPNVVSL
jgi:UDP-N-acetyl-D-glucosamine dehydrogenase